MRERVAVAGSGAIACGLAATVAARDEVVLIARSRESASRAEEQARAMCEKYGADGAVRVTTDVNDVREATFVVEAIVERPDAKHTQLAILGSLAPPDTIIATTTSSLSVRELSRASGRRDRFAGLHVFNPVPRMELVEVAFPDEATDDTRERTRALCRDLGKTPVEVPDVPGFVVNRLLFPYLFSAVRLLDETGLRPEDVDRCMTMGAGHPMGPLKLLDFVGLDVACAIGESIGADVPERVRRLVGEGALGRKAGRGFYEY